MATDDYTKLENLLNEQFDEGKSIPAFIANINVKPEDYAELKLTCGLTIPTPDAAIDRTQDIARKLIEDADTENLEKFSKYQNIINNILSFVRKYDVLVVQASVSDYENVPFNKAEVRAFVENATELDKEINKVLPELLQPVSRITKVLNFDNELNSAREMERALYIALRNAYRNGLAEIFKYIVIGDDLKL